MTDIYPWVNQLWPPEDDDRVTNMDVVFFSNLEDGRTAPTCRKPGETWVQKGHPEVCWPRQWLPEDLGSSVRIFEIRPCYDFVVSTGVRGQSPEEAALRELDDVAKRSLQWLKWKIRKDKDRQGCPLVFVGHGYGGLVLKQALVELHNRSGLYEDLRSDLCGIVFYGGTNTKLTQLKDWFEHRLLELSKCFEAVLDLKKVKVCVVNKNKSFFQLPGMMGPIPGGPAGMISPHNMMGMSPGPTRTNGVDADRWQRAPIAAGKGPGLIPSPRTSLPAMHKADKRYEVGVVSDEEQGKQRQIKSILNKLIPQNFDRLFLKVNEVNIDSAVTLTGVISQIFDKALTEPTFCEMYAKFCAQLATNLPEFTENDEKITFKRVLLNKCQEEFERGEREQEEAEKVEEEGEVNLTPQEREEKRLKARRRMLGNIRFIGELYKMGMLTQRIMHECIKKLLGHPPRQNPDEEDVEALCILMSTIGRIIDHPKAKEHIDAYFRRIKSLSNNQKLSSRLRFMLKDVIDLRRNGWQERCKVEGPKKIEDVNRDAVQERQQASANAGRDRFSRGLSMGGGPSRGRPGPAERPLLDRPFVPDRPGLGRDLQNAADRLIIDRPSVAVSSSTLQLQQPETILTPVAASPSTPLQLSEDELRKKSLSAITEYYNVRDVKEAALYVKELEAPDFHPTLVSIWVSDSLDKKETERSLLVSLLRHLYDFETPLLTQEEIARGLEGVLSLLEDTTVDVPRAPEYLAEMLAKLISAGVLSLSQVGKLLEEGGPEPGSLLEQDVALNIFGAILSTLRKERGEDYMVDTYRNSGLQVEDFLLPADKSKGGKLDAFLEKRHLQSLYPEIKDYSDLERQLTDVMESNDICTPTSKDDPSYLTLLEFLQQFLPKGLYQTIDDKKGQQVQLRLSETKDKEAWGDMEIASTSTRECRDKEMDERQGVVQHVVGNVDYDRDMHIEEAHNLRRFSRQEDGGSTTFPNLHELHSEFLKDTTSVFTGARKNDEKDSIEFLFLDAQCMSKVVGVGLHHALVTVTNDNDVKVEALSESVWKSLLDSMLSEVQDSGAFELIGFKMPKMEEDNIKTMCSPLPSKDVAKQFGVGLKDFQENHFITMNKREQDNMFFLVIWEVAKEYKALKEGDPHVTKRPSGVGSSTGASSASGASSSGSTQQGKEEGKSVRSWSLWKPSTWWEYGRGDEKDDEGKPPGGDPPPNSGPSSEPELVPRTYTVKVYPEAGGKFRGASEIPHQTSWSLLGPRVEVGLEPNIMKDISIFSFGFMLGSFFVFFLTSKLAVQCVGL